MKDQMQNEKKQLTWMLFIGLIASLVLNQVLQRPLIFLFYFAGEHFYYADFFMSKAVGVFFHFAGLSMYVSISFFSFVIGSIIYKKTNHFYLDKKLRLLRTKVYFPLLATGLFLVYFFLNTGFIRFISFANEWNQEQARICSNLGLYNKKVRKTSPADQYSSYYECKNNKYNGVIQRYAYNEIASEEIYLNGVRTDRFLFQPDSQRLRVDEEIRPNFACKYFYSLSICHVGGKNISSDTKDPRCKILDGTNETRFQDGAIHETFNCKDGRMDGEYRVYYPSLYDSQLAAKYLFKNGKVLQSTKYSMFEGVNEVFFNADEQSDLWCD